MILPSGRQQFALARYDMQGKLDAAFSDFGFAFTDVGGKVAVKSLTITADGKILAAGV